MRKKDFYKLRINQKIKLYRSVKRIVKLEVTPDRNTYIYLTEKSATCRYPWSDYHDAFGYYRPWLEKLHKLNFGKKLRAFALSLLITAALCWIVGASAVSISVMRGELVHVSSGVCGGSER